MKVEISFTSTEATRLQYFLRAYYNSKADLARLAKQAIRDVAAKQAAVVLERG